MSGYPAIRICLVITVLLVSLPVLAVEAWRISEIFSNTDGSIQYIKLSTSSDNQQNLSGRTIQALDKNGALGQTFTFPGNLGGPTANRSVLIGTAAFVAASQLSVDFQLPSGFLFTEGGSVQLVDIDTLSYQAVQLPRNGEQALLASGKASTAHPVNFAGQSVVFSTTAPSLFNGANAVVNLPVVDVPGMGVVNVSMQLTREDPFEFTLSDAYVYNPDIIAGAGAARFQHTGDLYLPGVIVGNELYELNMTLISENPIRFGNLEVVSVANLTPEPKPDPEPQPDPLQASISRGQTIYVQTCASCHGVNGGGTISGPSLIGYNTSSFASLRLSVNNTMPFGNPKSCVDNPASTCATDVTNYIIHSLN